MASPVNAALCALLATAFWSFLGYALTCHRLPRALAIGAAPVTGWAVHSAATLPFFFLIGFSPLAGVTMVGIRRRRNAGAGTGCGDPAEDFPGRGSPRRPDLRSFQDRDDRCHDAAGPAAGRSGFWR